MLEVINLSKKYKTRDKKDFFAIENVSFTLKENEILSIVGSSGSGKSTIGQIVSGIIKNDKGKIIYKNKEIKKPYSKDFRKDIQIIFQHPEVSFNPKLKIRDSMKEPYMLYKEKWSMEDIVSDIKKFGLKEEHLNRYPSELSGGELQRLAISRALSVSPSILVLDEPTSMLDVITQAQIISILKNYKERMNTSYIFITHNEALSKEFSDREIFIKSGKLINQD